MAPYLFARAASREGMRYSGCVPCSNPDWMGEGFLNVRTMRVSNVEYRLLFSGDEKGRDPVKVPDIQLRIQPSQHLDGSCMVPARLDENIYVVGTPGPACPGADAVSPGQNKGDAFLTERLQDLIQIHRGSDQAVAPQAAYWF